MTALELFLREEIESVLKPYDPSQINLLKLISREYNKNISEIYQEEHIRALQKKLEEYLDYNGNLNKKHEYGLCKKFFQGKILALINSLLFIFFFFS